jgi:tyrosine-protein kinase Etk/Wzc
MNDKSPDKVNYAELLRPYLKNWKWFGFSVIFAIFLAVLHIRYSTPEYSVKGKIQILEDQGASSEIGAFSDLGAYNGGNIKVEDEIEVLNSRSNFLEVVKKLGLNVRVKALGRIHDTELYTDRPFNVNFLTPDSTVYKSQGNFLIEILSETSFRFVENEDSPPKQYDFGSKVSTESLDFLLTPNHPDIGSLTENTYQLTVTPVSVSALSYQSKMQIFITDELSNIVSINLNDPVPQKAENIINTLVDTYNQNAINNKKLIAERTSNFINERIGEIYGELSTVDESEEEFKSTRGITDVDAQANINLTIGATSRQELQNAQVQLSIANAIKNDIDIMTGFELLPPYSGEGNLSAGIEQYNQFVLERNNLLKSSGERNPTVVNLSTQLGQLKANLRSSLERRINELRLQVNNLSGQLSRINSQIYTTPRNERALRDIARQKETTEALYLYLLQKREESQITFANTPPKSTIIDRAYLSSPFPVSPKVPIILVSSIVLGFLIPFSFIYINGLVDNKVHNKLGLEKLVRKIPVLAELPRLGSKEKMLVKSGDRSVLAESLRILRTNLDYLLKIQNKTLEGHVIFVTSSVPGEGKTFVASNLAMIYAKANKKVLLVGGDIRNPKLNQFYSGKNVDKLKRVSGNKDNKGLTDYLISDTLSARDITNTLLVSDQTVDIIHSGKLMPNPAELLMNDRLEEFVSEVREQYDYVIVDTAPMVVVSDTMLMSKFSDMVLYLTRADFTNQNVLDFPLKMNEEGKIKNLSFIVNGVKDSNLGYGGKYGYGYGQPSKKWWKLSA